ncbi:MAG: ABC transporter substrate-binding protein [Shimia sp.]|nr:ABC transporter substrate-binding protein [Shimia sp.]
MHILFALALLSINASASAAPRQVEHAYGITEINVAPKRVVSLSYIGHDFLLALGVKPIALRHWYGPHDFGVWPWAQEVLGNAEPTVLYGGIDIDQIALLEPDLIVGQWSGMTKAEYALLSQIAPTLAHPKDESPYSASWQQMTQQLGRVLDQETDAKRIVADLETRFSDIRAAHPEWQNATAVAAFAPRLSAYGESDLRGRFLKDLGFSLPKDLEKLARFDANFIRLEQENIGTLDTDVLIWVHAQDINAALNSIVLRSTLNAYREGREVYANFDVTAALNHSSPLSLSYALDNLVPLLEAAFDGDPDTRVPGWNSTKEVIAP